MEGKDRITTKKKIRMETPKAKIGQLTLAEVQRPVNTLHPRTTPTLSPKTTHLPVSSDDFSASSPQPKTVSPFRNLWSFSQGTLNNPLPALDKFASPGPLNSSSTVPAPARRSVPEVESPTAHDHGIHKSLLKCVDLSLKRSTSLPHGKSLDLDEEKEKDVHHLLYPEEQFEDDMWPTPKDCLSLKSPYFKTDTIAQIKLHQIFIGSETILANEMSVRFYLQKFLSSELMTIITPTEEEIPLDLSSIRCSKIKVSLKAAPYFIEIQFIQQSALPVELMSLCAPGTALGTGWARFCFAKPDPSKGTKSHLDVLLTVDKCLQGVFGDKVSEAIATDIHYLTDRWRSYTKPSKEGDTYFYADLSSKLKESRNSKSHTPSKPLQTNSNSSSSVATRRSSRLVCYSSRKKQSMDDDVQTISSRFVTSHHTDSSSAKPLFIYPEDDPHGILVTTNELARLEPGIYLNDTLVELDLRWIFEDIKPSLQQTSFYFSSFFYRKLTANNHSRQPYSVSSQSQDSRNELAHRQVRKWTQNINIFERDFLFIPICEHLHWYLIIVAFPEAMLTGRKIKNQDMEEDEEYNIDENAMSVAVSSDAFDTENFFGFSARQEEELSENEAQSAAQSVTPINSLSTQFPTSEIELGEAKEAEPSVGFLRRTAAFISGNKVTNLISGSTAAENAGKHMITDLVSTSQLVQENSSSVIFDDDACKESAQKDFDSDQKCYIICYDSLGGGRSKQVVFNNIKNYLVAEAADKLNEEADTKRSHGMSLKGPIQTNSTDCGLFMLQAIETFLSEDAPDAWVKNFVKTNDYSKWFAPSLAVLRRQAMRERVVRTAEQFSIKAHAIFPTTLCKSVADDDDDDDDLVILSGPPSPTL